MQDNQDIPLNDKLINLLCSPESHNRTLAFQLAHKKEKLYPKFYEFVGEVFKTYLSFKHDTVGSSFECKHIQKMCVFLLEDFKKATLKRKEKIWEDATCYIRSVWVDCMPTVRLDVFYNLTFLAVDTTVFYKKIEDIALLCTSNAKDYRFSKLKKVKDFSPLNGKQIRELYLTECQGLVDLPTIEISYMLNISKCQSVNEDSFDNVTIRTPEIIGYYAEINVNNANIHNGKALARCINRGLYEMLELRLANTPLANNENALHSFLSSLDKSKSITIVGFTREQVSKYKPLFPQIDFV